MKQYQFFLILFALSFVVYARSLPGNFVYDDKYFIVENKAIRTVTLFRYFSDHHTASSYTPLSNDIYRPLTTFSHALTYAVDGLNPAVFRAVNMVLHLCCAMLVFWLSRMLGLQPVWSACASMLFCFFPPNAQAMIWISGRSNVLFLLFYLLSLILFIRYTSSGTRWFLAASLVAFALSIFSKEMAITLPVMLVLYLYYFRGIRLSSIVRLKHIYCYLLISLTYIAMRVIIAGSLNQEAFDTLSRTSLLVPVLFTRFLTILLWPFTMKISYTTDIAAKLASPWFPVISCVTMILFIFIAVIAVYKKNTLLSFGLAWIVCTLLPVLNIIPIVSYLNERFLYLPSIGFAWVTVIILKALYKRRILRLPVICIFFIVTGSYALESHHRAGIWHHDISLWSYAVASDPRYWINYMNLSSAYRDQQRYAAAVQVLEDAFTIATTDKQKSTILSNAGINRASMKDYTSALEYFNRALQHQQTSDAYFNRGKILLAMGNKNDAYRDFERSLVCDPSHALTVNILKEAYQTYQRVP